MIPLAARRRAMHAAHLAGAYSVRDAAVLGGIVRSVIETGRADVEFVADYARDALDVFDVDGVDRSVPCAVEIDMVRERFEAACEDLTTD